MFGSKDDLNMVHFKTMIFLMMFFFATYVALDVSATYIKGNISDAIQASHDAFIAFFSAAIVTFKGVSLPGPTTTFTREPPVPLEPKPVEA